jgi:4-hydroxy-3-polyprenylbenzoate decarboxylase
MVDTQARPETSAALHDLRGWLAAVEAIGELRTIDAPVDPIEEMSAISYLISRTENAPAVLFTDVRGAMPGVRSLFNMTGSSRRRLALAMGLADRDDLLGLVQELRGRLSKRIEPVVVDAATAPVNEVVIRGDDVDLLAFAPPRHWPFDGGQYIGTGDVVITRDPDSGRLNVGTYRMMVHDRNHAGLSLEPGKDAKIDVVRTWKRGERVPVAAVVGLHPLWLALGAQKFPKDLSEYEAIGGVIGAPLELIAIGSDGIRVPAAAEIVLEGYVEVHDSRQEGPFGEFTGYYGTPDADAPVMTVTAIHHRRGPILTNALLGEYPANETSLLGSVARSAKLWDDLDRLGIPGIRGVWTVPAAANGKAMAVVSVEQRYPGHAAQVLALVAQAPATAYFTKWIIAVDDDIDPTNMNEVISAMSTRCSPADDLDILRHTWGSRLDPSVNPPELRLDGSKVLVNACKEHRYLASFPKRMALHRETWERVAGRWSRDLRLPGVAPRPWTLVDERAADASPAAELGRASGPTKASPSAGPTAGRSPDGHRPAAGDGGMDL